MDKPNNDQLYRNILDEIFFRNPLNPTKHTETRNGVTRVVETVLFADGSKISITAQVRVPPLADMTPERIYYMNMNGERGESYDDGSGEALALARQSMAVRLLEHIARLVDTLPEAKTRACPDCHGAGICVDCEGDGCVQCYESGVCQVCNGRGIVPSSEG